MKTVYIPTEHNSIPIWRQLPNQDSFIWGNYKFVFKEGLPHDYIAVLDCLYSPIKTTCPKDRRLLFLGEPPYVKRYPKSYLEQFGSIYSCQRNLVKKFGAKVSMPALPWMIGCQLKDNSHSIKTDVVMTYEDFKNFNKIEGRLDKACLITSNKTFTKGHRDRVRFANRILNNKIDFVDVYGNGYKHIDDKFEILSKYKYAVVVENGCYTDYWTEKLGDCMLAGCYPIYYGAPNIDSYFDGIGYNIIDINDFQKCILEIQSIIASHTYESNIDRLLYNKTMTIDKFNLFNIISSAIDILPTIQNGETREIFEIHPFKLSIWDNFCTKVTWKTGLNL